MTPDSSGITDLIALWPVVAAAALAIAAIRVLTVPARVVRRMAVAGGAVVLLAAAGLWVWLGSDAGAYHDGSSHLDHMSGANIALALLALAAALVVAVAAIRRPSRTLVAAALAMSALACVAQTYGFLGYTTPG
jgi:hypothetical protein